MDKIEKAIILSAGVGSRLNPLTYTKPKTLIKVNKVPMLKTIINGLINNGVCEIIIVVGYLKEKIIEFCRKEFPQILFKYVVNENYDSTNNMYSLYLAKQHIHSNFYLMNSDLVFEEKIIEKLSKMNKTSIAVDKGVFLEEAMKICLDKKHISKISKDIKKENSYGSSTDVYLISKNDAPLLKKEITKVVEKEKNLNQWTEVALNTLFERKIIKAESCNIHGLKWFEIDNYEDLEEAEILFNNNFKKLKNKKLFFLDKDGTLLKNKTPIEGSKNFLKKLRDRNKKIYLCTNNSSLTPKEHFLSIKKNNLDIREKEILSSLDSSLDYFKEKNIKKIFALCSKKVEKYIEKKGINVNYKNPQALLLTYDVELTYKKLVSFIDLINKQIPYYATHPDLVCPMENSFIPDIGCYIYMIKEATSKTPLKIFGKPSLDFIIPKIKKDNVNEEDIVVIGDRIYTDIKMCEKTKILSILVFSGETTRENYEDNDINADIVISSIDKLTKFL